MDSALHFHGARSGKIKASEQDQEEGVMVDVVGTVVQNPGEQAQTSLGLAVGLSLIAFWLVFFRNFHEQFGLAKFNVPVLLSHPQALGELMFEAFGGSLLLATVHVGVASIWKSKRNARSRRRIYIGWSIFIIGLTIFGLVFQR